MGGGAETKGQRTKTADRETGHVQRSVSFESCRGHTYKTSLEAIYLSQLPPCAIHVPSRGLAR